MRIDEYISGLEKSAKEQKEKDRQLQASARKDLKEKEKIVKSILIEKRKELEKQYGIPTLRAVCAIDVDTYAYENEFDKKLKRFKIETTIKEVLSELEKVTGEKFVHEVAIRSEDVNKDWGFLDKFHNSTITFSSKSHKFDICGYSFDIKDEIVVPEQMSLLDAQQKKTTFGDFVKCGSSDVYSITYYANIPKDVVPQLPLHLKLFHIHEMQKVNRKADSKLFFQALTNIYERNQSAAKTATTTGGKDDK